MPMYDYRCRDCGHEFEVQQSFSDDALTECPACSGDLRKVFSPVGISFKGSGFYKTDSQGSGKTRSSSTAGGDGSSDSSSSDSSSSTTSATDGGSSSASTASSSGGDKGSSTTSAA